MRDKPSIRREPAHPIFRNAGFLLLARFVNLASRLAFVLIVARALGVADYGIYVFIQSWCLLFVPLTQFGAQSVLARAFGHGAERGLDVAGNLLGLGIRVLPIIVIVCLLTGWLVEPERRSFFVVAAFGLMGRGAAMWANHFFVASERSEKVLRLDTVFRPLEVLAAFAVLSAGGGIVSLLLVYATAWWLQAVVSAVWIKRTYPAIRPAWSARASGSLLRQCAASLIVSLATVWFLQGPLAVGRQVLDATAFGQFALAMQLIHVCIVVPNTVGNAAVPALSRSHMRGGRLDRHFFMFAGPFSFLLVVALAGLAHAFGDAVIPSLFGASFEGAAALLPLGLAAFLAPHSIALLLSSAALARGHFRWASVAASVAIFVAVLLAFAIPFEAPATGILLAFGAGSVVWTIFLIPRLVVQRNRGFA